MLVIKIYEGIKNWRRYEFKDYKLFGIILILRIQKAV